MARPDFDQNVGRGEETVVSPGAEIISEEDLEGLTNGQYFRNVYFGIPGERPNIIFSTAQARENYAAMQEGREPTDVGF